MALQCPTRRRAREAAIAEGDSFPDVLFVHMNDVAAGDAFFAEHAPDERAIADPERALYAAFGVKRASILQ
jgi:hypothetical protein